MKKQKEEKEDWLQLSDMFQMSNSLKSRSGTLSTLNTIEDIASVLVREVTGDEYIGKVALFNWAQMYLKTTRFNDFELGDIVEYFLLVGNQARFSSPEDVKEYISIKQDINQKKGNPRSYHPKLKSLLKHLIINKSIERYSEDVEMREHHPEHMVDERSISFFDIQNSLQNTFYEIISGAIPDDSPSPKIDKMSNLYPEIENVGKILLSNFPIMQRINISDFDDIIACIEIDDMMQHISQPYKEQIQSQIEEGITDPENQEKLLTAQDVLQQVKLSYFISRGVQTWIPRISKKHFDSHYEQSLLSKVVSWGRRSREDYKQMDKVSNFEQDLMYDAMMRNYNNRESFRNKKKWEHDHFVKKKKKMSEGYYIGIMREINEFFIGENPHEKIFAKRVMGSILGDTRIKAKNWKEVISQTQKMFDMDIYGLLIVSTSANLDIDGRYKQTDEESVFVPEYVEIKEIHSEHLNEKRIGDVDLEDCRIKIPLDETKRIPFALIATYVCNNVISSMKDISSLSKRDINYWYSPMNFSASYNAEDLFVANRLLSRYPIFSQIPVLTEDDITNGIVLSMLMGLTGDHNIDKSVTITQNLMIKQLNTLNQMVDINESYKHKRDYK